MENDELIDRVCRGVASIQEGEELRAYIESLRLTITELRPSNERSDIPETLQEHFRAWAKGFPTIRENHALLLLRAADRLDKLDALERAAPETRATQPPDSRGDTAIWVLAWLAHKGGLGHDAHRVIDAVMENRAVMRSDGTLHIEPRPELKAGEQPVAYVPIHPRYGPLWANTVPTLESERPSHYPVMALYARAHSLRE